MICDAHFELSELCKNAHVVENLTHFRHIEISSHRYDKLTYIVVCILIPVGLLSNGLIIRLVTKFKKLQNPTGYMIASLSITDFLIAILLLAYVFFHTFKFLQTVIGYYCLTSIDILLSSVSLLHIAAISIERAVAVLWPLRFKSNFKKTTRITVSVIWLVCIVQAVSAFCTSYTSNELYVSIIFYIIVVTSFLVPLIIVCVSYTCVVITALKNVTEKRSFVRKCPMENVDERIRAMRCREVKIAINVAAMVLPICSGWSFFFISTIYEEISGVHYSGLINWFLTYIPFISSSVNPFIYIGATNTLRKCAMQFIDIFYRFSAKGKCSIIRTHAQRRNMNEFHIQKHQNIEQYESFV